MSLRAGRVIGADPLEKPKARERKEPRRRSDAYAAYERAYDAAWKAIRDEDADAMLRLLDDPGLGEQRGERHAGFRAGRVEDARARLWRSLEGALERRGRDALTIDRVMRALDEESDFVVDALVYRLFPFEHLARPIADALASAPDGRLRKRLEAAVDAWPDFPHRPAAARVSEPKITPGSRLIKQLDAVLPTLRLPKLHGFRKLLREIREAWRDEAVLDEARTHAVLELVSLARPEEPARTRAFALEILLAMGVSFEELEPLTKGLAESGALRALRSGRESHAPKWSELANDGLRRGGLTYRVQDRSLSVTDEAGRTLRTHDVPFAPTVGLLDLGDRGVLAWDGRYGFGRPLESGLWVRPDGTAEELLPALLLADVEPVDPPAPPAQAEPAFVSEPHEVDVMGVVWDLDAIGKPADRGLAESELRRLDDARGSFVTCLGNLARIFRKAHVEIATRDRREGSRDHYVLDGGDLHFEPSFRPEEARTRLTDVDRTARWDVLVGRDMRRLPERTPPTGGHAAFTEGRAGFARALDAREPTERLLGRLLEPALRPEGGTLARIAREYRILAHDAVARVATDAPVAVLADVLAVEDDEVARRFVLAWGEKARSAPALAARYRAERSPLLRGRLRALLGYVADRIDRQSTLERAISRAEAAKRAPATGGSADAVRGALAAALALTPLPEPVGPKRRRTKAESTALAEAGVLVDEARRSGDPDGMLAALDLPALSGVRGYELRDRLWSTLLERARSTLTIDRVLAALQVEPDGVADYACYKLYLQSHLAGDVGSALDLARASSPLPDRMIRRLSRAISEWPDHPKR